MNITIREQTPHTVIEITGEITIYNVSKLNDAVNRLADGSVLSMVIDLELVSAIDSNGIAALYAAKRKIEAFKGMLYIANPMPSIKNVLRLTGLSFTIIELNRS